MRLRQPFPPLVAALLAAVALLAAGGTARADDPFQTTIGISLNPIAGGYHESFNDKISLPPIPVPLLEASQRLGPFELAGYGLPPTVAIPYTDAIQGQTTLRLTIFDASLRLWAPRRRIGIEAGETIYNQTTHYATADSYADSPASDERQYSRIAGGHYGIITHLPFRSGTIETELRYAPVLLGTQVSTYGDNSPSRFDPERGEQIDANLRFIRRAGKNAELFAGARYVNFTASYDVPGRPLSDRNCAVLPSIGYRFVTGP